VIVGRIDQNELERVDNRERLVAGRQACRKSGESASGEGGGGLRVCVVTSYQSPGSYRERSTRAARRLCARGAEEVRSKILDT